MEEWSIFLAPYRQAVEELKIKLKGIRKDYQITSQSSPVEFVTSRVKPVQSIIEKASTRNIPYDNLRAQMYDIAGIRIMCQFVDDINVITEHIRSRNDMRVIEERDYIENTKESGYRSYHIIIEYPVESVNGRIKILAEIQIRTLAMNFWATIEHTLNYKYSGEYPPEIKNRLQNAAEAAYLLDKEMSEIREEVQEAQKYFSKKRNI
ncbi:GTP pyrophosphokinase family protein [Jeotgalicoccus huakuii]|uniref:GTP pyrophosphokinase n=1 Tax=Jeotgalicoccus TaxID=227979 RepID=UPI00041FD2B7|nr:MULTISPECIES: GTP pyrophosphokinase family protein [Jeotgalicoccus]MCK1976486.1 GTP pyrophosphokinase family protein [Jeotgalicoccus huakuii]QQD85907.1 GTP pyrophosphokinase family protein [Jeotgalicoccus sp. ATCC 8456]